MIIFGLVFGCQFGLQVDASFEVLQCVQAASFDADWYRIDQKIGPN